MQPLMQFSWETLSSPQGFALTSARQLITFLNGIFSDLFFFTEEDLMGVSLKVQIQIVSRNSCTYYSI